MNWKTATEQNSRSFEIERSADGRAFSKTGTVAAAGNSTIERSYSLVDANPLKWANYYRLKLLNTDGSFTCSELRVLNYSDQYSIAIYPNPVKNYAIVTGAETGMTIELLNAASQKLQAVKATAATTSLTTTQLPAGLYQVQVRSQGGAVIYTQKLIKE